MATPQAGQPKRVLSLDGGGVRGLSTILILKRLMRRYNESTEEADEKHSWEVFDMISGTSTGGIIAIMLGRLQMTLEECENAYLRLAEKIFSPRRSTMNSFRVPDCFQANGKFDHKVLEDAVRFELKRLAESRKSLAVLGPQTAQGGSASGGKNSGSLKKPRSQRLEPSKPRKVLLFGRNKHFVGRQAELNNLSEIFCGEDSGEDCQYAVLDGLSGIGTTQMALEFAIKIQELSPEHSAFWVQASDVMTFENSYRKIGEKLQISGLNDDNADVKKLLKEWLSKESIGKWLLIIDNADDSKLFYNKIDNTASLPLYEYLLFSSLGGILFTTRDHDAATRYAGSDVIENKRPLEDQSGTAMLLALFVNFPLAIMQAAAYLNSKSTTISQYLDLYKESSKNEITQLQMDFKGRWRYGEMNNAVATTWIISFKQIQHQDKLAADYMRFIACIKEHDIPWGLLPELTSLQRNNALGTLKGFGFLNKREGERFYNMHRLVHLATQNWMRHEKLMSAWIETALRRLVNVIPYGGHQHREKWTACIPHGLQVADSLDLLETVEEEKLDLLDRIGRCESSIGQYSAAAETYGRVLELRMKVLGKEHTSTLTVMSNLGQALNVQGEYPEAEKMLRETLTLREKVLGKEHSSTLTSMNNLGLALSNQGKYTEAEKMFRETLTLREKVLGNEHPETLVSMNNLGQVLSKQEKYAEAEKMHRETLALREKVLGKEYRLALMSIII